MVIGAVHVQRNRPLVSLRLNIELKVFIHFTLVIVDDIVIEELVSTHEMRRHSHQVFV